MKRICIVRIQDMMKSLMPVLVLFHVFLGCASTWHREKTPAQWVDSLGSLGKERNTQTVTKALGLYGRESLPLLVQMLEGKDENRRILALQAIVDMCREGKAGEAKDALPTVKAMLEKYNREDIPFTKEEMLKKRKSSLKNPVLSLVSFKSDFLKITILMALRGMGVHAEKALPEIARCLSSPNTYVREIALTVIVHFRKKSVPIFIHCTNSKDMNVIKSGLMGLYFVGRYDPVLAIRHLLKVAKRKIEGIYPSEAMYSIVLSSKAAANVLLLELDSCKDPRVLEAVLIALSFAQSGKSDIISAIKKLEREIKVRFLKDPEKLRRIAWIALERLQS